MPIWFELIVLLLATYVAGLGIGWLLWGRDPASESADRPSTLDEDGETL